MANENVALIVGSGAVKNAWNPVIRALQTYYPNDFQLDKNGANSFLANLVFLRRYFELKKSDKAEELYKNVKRKLSDNIVESERNGEIKAQPALRQIINRFIVEPKNNLLPITTNWDSTIMNAINSYEYPNAFKFSERLPGIYLHGKATEPDSLYLPSEIGDESYRSEQHRSEYRIGHAHTVKLLSDCDRAILYGISLDPLDAELANMLALGLGESKKLKEIIIVNPDFNGVCQRIRAHFIGVPLPNIVPLGHA